MAIETADLDTPLWRFSIQVYGQPGVEAACLFLQDRRGLDVNLILGCLWFGAELGLVLRPDQVAELDRIAAAWRRDVVQPLRQVRRRLKAGPPPGPGGAAAALRRQVQEAELVAEQIEQASLFAFMTAAAAGLVPAVEWRGRAQSQPKSVSAARANMACLVAMGDAQGWRCVERLIAAGIAVNVAKPD